MDSSNASDSYPKKPGASIPTTVPAVSVPVPRNPSYESYWTPDNSPPATDLHPQPTKPPAVGVPVPTNTAYVSYEGPYNPLPPTGLHPRPTSYQPWSSGLCSCFGDVPICCLSFWCPCITFGRIAEIVDHGSPSCPVNGAIYLVIAWLTGCACCYSCFYRTKMRKQYQLQEDPCNDCLVHCCCETCALTQEYRELKRRGFDLSIGWRGNMERQNGGIPMAPVPPGGMMR